METAMNYLPGMEANQLAILQAWPRIWTRDYHEQIQLAVRAELELKASELQFQHSNNAAMLPLFFLWEVAAYLKQLHSEIRLKCGMACSDIF